MQAGRHKRPFETEVEVAAKFAHSWTHPPRYCQFCLVREARDAVHGFKQQEAEYASIHP